MEKHGAPHIQLPKVKVPQPRPTTATPQQIQTLLSKAPPWLRLFILLCWQTALRSSEAHAVTPRTYDQKTATVSIPTKGGKHRVIPVTEQIQILLAPTLEGDPDQSCIALLKGRSCSLQTVRNAWTKLTHDAGIKDLRPHDLRRTTATALYRATKDLRAVQQYLGHEHMSSTTHYLAPLNQAELREYQRLLRFHSEVKQ